MDGSDRSPVWQGDVRQGFPIGVNRKGEPVVLDSRHDVLCVSSETALIRNSVMLPLLATWKGSALITDIDGRLRRALGSLADDRDVVFSPGTRFRTNNQPINPLAWLSWGGHVGDVDLKNRAVWIAESLAFFGSQLPEDGEKRLLYDACSEALRDEIFKLLTRAHAERRVPTFADIIRALFSEGSGLSQIVEMFDQQQREKHKFSLRAPPSGYELLPDEFDILRRLTVNAEHLALYDNPTEPLFRFGDGDSRLWFDVSADVIDAYTPALRLFMRCFAERMVGLSKPRALLVTGGCPALYEAHHSRVVEDKLSKRSNLRTITLTRSMDEFSDGLSPVLPPNVMACFYDVVLIDPKWTEWPRLQPYFKLPTEDEWQPWNDGCVLMLSQTEPAQMVSLRPMRTTRFWWEEMRDA